MLDLTVCEFCLQSVYEADVNPLQSQYTCPTCKTSFYSRSKKCRSSPVSPVAVFPTMYLLRAAADGGQGGGPAGVALMKTLPHGTC